MLSVILRGDPTFCRSAEARIRSCLGQPDYVQAIPKTKLVPLIKAPHVYGRSKERFGEREVKYCLFYSKDRLVSGGPAAVRLVRDARQALSGLGQVHVRWRVSPEHL